MKLLLDPQDLLKSMFYTGTPFIPLLSRSMNGVLIGSLLSGCLNIGTQCSVLQQLCVTLCNIVYLPPLSFTHEHQFSH